MVGGVMAAWRPKGSAAVGYSAAAQAFFDRLASQPTASRKTAYDAMISGLVYAGVWSKLDGLYVLAAADAATARTNLVQSSFGATVVGSVTFAADAGYTGDNTTGSYLETGFDPTVGTPHFARDSGSIFAWKNTNPAADVGILIGTSNGTNYVEPYRVDGKYYISLNAAGSGNTAAFASNTGLFEASRSSSTAVQGYISGTLIIDTTTSNSTALTAAKTMEIVGAGATGGTNAQVSAAGFGSSLSAPDSRNVSAYITNYLNTVAGTSPAVTLGFSSDIVNDGANNYIPGLARLADGRLFAVYCVGSVAAQQNGVITYKTSSDNGKTWSASSTIATPAAAHTYTDTSATVLSGGIIIIAVMYQANDGSTTTTKVIRGTVAGDLSISWGAPIDIASSGANPATTSYVLPLADGRLMLPIYIFGGGVNGVRVVFSSDSGLTWGNETTVTNNGALSETFNESNFLQLTGGTIIGVLRNDNATASHKGYWITSSADNGATWSTPAQVIDNTLASSPARPALSLTPSGKILLVSRFIGPNTAFQTLYTYSSDNGATWSAPANYYNIGTKSYGAHTYAQGFYDATTSSLMYAICQGGFTAAQINFQQFYLP